MGFQRAEKLDGEAPIYRRLTRQGVQVIAFGTGTPAEVAQVRWVRLPEDHGALQNQWSWSPRFPNHRVRVRRR